MKFKDLIAKNANSIVWRDIVGTEASLDDRGGDDFGQEETAPEDEDKMEVDKASTSQQQEKREPVVAVPSLEVEPAAGPWSAVAKSLQ